MPVASQPEEPTHHKLFLFQSKLHGWRCSPVATFEAAQHLGQRSFSSGFVKKTQDRHECWMWSKIGIMVSVGPLTFFLSIYYAHLRTQFAEPQTNHDRFDHCESAVAGWSKSKGSTLKKWKSLTYNLHPNTLQSETMVIFRNWTSPYLIFNTNVQ